MELFVEDVRRWSDTQINGITYVMYIKEVNDNTFEGMIWQSLDKGVILKIKQEKGCNTKIIK